MSIGGVVVQWECKQCGGRGSLLFAHGQTVGHRLRECEDAHRDLGTLCRLDWNNVVVTHFELPDDFFAQDPHAS